MTDKKWLNQLETLKALAQSYDKEAYPTCGLFEPSEDLVLPEDYRAVLAVVNGLEWDGHILYGHVADRPSSQDFAYHDLLDMNAVWHEVDSTDFLYLGKSDMSWWGYDRQSQSYQELDKPSGDLLTTFLSCDNFLSAFLASALGEGTDLE